MKTKIILSLAVGAVCLWLSLRGINWSEVGVAFRQIRVAPLFLAFFMMFLTHFSRARRWAILVRPIHPVPLRDLFVMNSVGFLAIHVIPFRLGEFTRPLLLKKRHNIPFSTGLAMVAVERVFDGLAAALVLYIGVLGTPFSLGETTAVGLSVNTMVTFSLALFVPLLGFLVLCFVARERALRILRWIFRILPPRLADRAHIMAANFFEGLRCLPNVSGILRLSVESMVVWGVMVVAYWAVFSAFGIDLPWGASFTALGVAAIGVMLPNAPLFIGTFQLFVQAALVLYGLSKSVGLAYAMVVYTLNLLYVLGVGFLCLPMVTRKPGALLHEMADRSSLERETQAQA